MRTGRDLRTVLDYATEKLFKPLGIEHAQRLHDPIPARRSAPF